MGQYLKIYGGSVTAGATDGIAISEGDNSNPVAVGSFKTTLTSGVVAGATNITVANASGFLAGQTIIIGTGNTQENKLISSIAGNTINLTTALTNAQNSGATVAWYLSATTGEISAPIKLAIRTASGYTTGANTNIYTTQAKLTSAVTAGTTNITVNQNIGFSVGQTIVIGTEKYTISAIAGTTITLTTGLLSDKASGVLVAGLGYDRWRFSADGVAWQDWGVPLVLPSEIGSANTTFYAQAKANVGDVPQNDTSLDLIIDCSVISVV